MGTFGATDFPTERDAWKEVDPKTFQALLRHANVITTLGQYSHSISADRMAAQGEMLEAILNSATVAVQ
jgi:hypothetical protein